MQFFVSTVSVDVQINDLGIFISHPTVDRDLGAEFTPEELSHSANLTDAIKNGLLSLKLDDNDYVTTQVDGYYYSPYVALQKSLSIFNLTDRFVISDELKAKDKNIEIYPGVFPIQVSSTTSGTKTIVCNSASLESWSASPGDIVLISGGAAAGTYTIATVDSQKQFTVVESIVTTLSSGVLTIYHPTGASIVGFDSTGLLNTASDNLQDAIKDLDSAITGGGITESYHENIDSLVHNISEDNYEEIVYSGSNVISITHYTNISKTTKVREFQFSYSGNKIYQQIVIQYNALGVEIQRLTSTYTYNGKLVVSATHVETP